MKKLKKAALTMLAVSLVTVLVAACNVQDSAAAGRGSGSSSAGKSAGSSTGTNKSSGANSTSSDDSTGTDSAGKSAASSSGTDSGNKSSSGTVSSKPFTPAGIPEVSGSIVEKNDYASIDYSNTVDGYVMVDYLADTANRLKVQVEGPSTTYTYNIEVGEWTALPLSDGDGSYKVTVYEGVGGNKYSTVLSTTFQVSLKSEFAPFLHANQYVDYSGAVNTMAKTAELTGGAADTLEKVGNIYDFVVKNVKYDTQKAANIQSGYLPVLDEVLASGKGICFDYASLMAGMLRSCEIPCKLVVGYSGEAYHAWISVWSEETGWLDDIIYFDGESWQRMDPTFASSNNGSSAVMQYIGDGDNYRPMYQY